MSELLENIGINLQNGKAKIVQQLVRQALDEGMDAMTVLEQGLLPGMAIIGEKFKNNEIFVPEVLVSARALNKGTAILKEKLVGEGFEEKGTVVLGTVKGDLHDIGKNLVGMMMESKGLKVIDLGVDVEADKFVAAAKENNADIVALSALLTTTMSEMKGIIEAGRAECPNVKFMVGGAPVSPAFAENIGATAYTDDAASAAEQALALCAL